MELVYNNVRIDIEAVSFDFESNAGYNCIEVELPIFEKVLDQMGVDFKEHIIYGDIQEELGEFIGSDTWDSNEWIQQLASESSVGGEEYYDEYFEENSYNIVRLQVADSIILFLHECLSCDFNIRLRYEGNPLWLCHDIHHAKYDCAAGAVSVDADIEELRMVQGFDLLKDTLNAPHYVSIDMFLQINKAFNDRFGRDMKVPRIMEYLGLEEEQLNLY